jgi:hypothetical protein
MKKTILIPFLIAALAVAAIPLILVGCGTTGTAHVNTTNGTTIGAGVGLNVTSNGTVNLEGTYDTTNGQWTAGVVIVFKDAPPSWAVEAIQDAGGRLVTSQTKAMEYRYEIPQAEASSKATQLALILADEAGGKLYPLK